MKHTKEGQVQISHLWNYFSHCGGLDVTDSVSSDQKWRHTMIKYVPCTTVLQNIVDCDSMVYKMKINTISVTLIHLNNFVIFKHEMKISRDDFLPTVLPIKFLDKSQCLLKVFNKALGSEQKCFFCIVYIKSMLWSRPWFHICPLTSALFVLL